MTSEISERSRRPRSVEEVVHQQRGLARRGRALERRRGDADDHPAAVEVGQHVAQRERAGDGVELVAALDQAGRGRRVEVGAERDDEDVGVERPGVGLDALGDRVDRPDGRLDEPHAGLDEVAVGVAHGVGAATRPNITSSFEKPNTKPSLWSISTTSTSSPNSSDSRVVSSSPPNPAPSTTMRMAGRLSRVPRATARPVRPPFGDQTGRRGEVSCPRRPAWPPACRPRPPPARRPG